MLRNLPFAQKSLLLLAGILFSTLACAQPFTRQDSLRGTLSPLRSCYDVTFYDLHFRVNVADQSITGRNTVHYRTVAPFTQLQIDLFANLRIDSIRHRGRPLVFTREGNATFVTFPQSQPAGRLDSFTVHYGGKPTVAVNPPWDGGFTWAKDGRGRPWVSVSCEGIGASIWWPNKDHLSDEPDSVKITGEAPENLDFIANGNQRRRTVTNGLARTEWFVSYPINNYNVTFALGNYASFADTWQAQDGQSLPLDYYVLDYNLDKAKAQFAQVKPMLTCYEKVLGKYPFWRDGFALVETPFLGMEHQSAIAYGNDYRPGYRGRDMHGLGLDFDYIIVHEAGHEWWGNSVSMRDIADMWIHEGFCTYSEIFFVECKYNPETALKYINSFKAMVENQEPIIGAYGVNDEGPGDMYFKAALMLHTIRNVLDDEARWRPLIGGLAERFRHRTTSTPEVIAYFNEKTGRDLTKIFDQYLRHKDLPVFEYQLVPKGKKTELRYRWQANVAGFAMPLKVGFARGTYQFIQPTLDWQTTVLNGSAANFRVAEELFYVQVKPVTSPK